MLDTMGAAGVPVDASCLTQALRACGRAGAPDAARELLERSPDAYGVVLGERAWRSAMQACGRAGAPEAALTGDMQLTHSSVHGPTALGPIDPREVRIESEPHAVLTMTELQNGFISLDPTHFRSFKATMLLTYGSTEVECRCELHYHEIFAVGSSGAATTSCSLSTPYLSANRFTRSVDAATLVSVVIA